MISVKLRSHSGSDSHSHLVGQHVDVDLPFSVLLRLVKQWSPDQQEVSVTVGVDV